jgi:hypothetical protein
MTQAEIDHICSELNKEWIEWHAGDTGIKSNPLEKKLRELLSNHKTT